MRATNLVIGTLTLAAVIAAIVGLLVVQKVRTAQQRSPLRVVFDGGSAAGLRKGGPVNFDGVHAGQIVSVSLDSPRRIVVLVTLDNSAPIRKDTTAGIEFQGLTGIAAISLVGGAPAAPPVPLDVDGVPVACHVRSHRAHEERAVWRRRGHVVEKVTALIALQTARRQSHSGGPIRV